MSSGAFGSPFFDGVTVRRPRQPEPTAQGVGPVRGAERATALQLGDGDRVIPVRSSGITAGRSRNLNRPTRCPPAADRPARPRCRRRSGHRRGIPRPPCRPGDLAERAPAVVTSHPGSLRDPPIHAGAGQTHRRQLSPGGILGHDVASTVGSCPGDEHQYQRMWRPAGRALPGAPGGSTSVDPAAAVA